MRLLLQQSWQTLLAHRLKSVLAITAISWGVISVVILMALGEGFYRAQTESFRFLLQETQMVASGQTSEVWQGMPARRPIQLTESLMREVAQRPEIQRYSIVYENREVSITQQRGTAIGSMVSGVDRGYFSLAGLKLTLGSRDFSLHDQHNHRRVAILGDHVAATSQLKIGDEFKIRGIAFRVIGIMDDESSRFSFGDNQKVFIPSSTFKDIWDTQPNMMLVLPAQGVSSWALREQLRHTFAQRLHFSPEDQEAVFLPDFGSGVAVITAILRGIQAFLATSGMMTMAVGILGVANMMFLAVTERTREIGVRLAIGATPQRIQQQFLLEGLLLVVIGALVGLLLAYFGVLLLNHLGLPTWLGEPVITSTTVWLSMLVTSILALAAAYFPARRAAQLEPVIALSSRS
ncbi:ABC transporter permease [Vibrio cholerae]|uniref:ABC transporter permease n=1 Tax=Vibrio cholerae TaxID=666 RepID=UPI000BA9CBB0|nr:ABC transporter permease [Vibrio cholerae]PAS30094.1 ABC transporter substrate-binding protein [Vibrio cholerae]